MMALHPVYRDRLRPVLWLLGALALVLVMSWLAPPVQAVKGIAGYAPLHTLMEMAAIVVSMLVFAVGWAAHSRERPGNLLLLACVFFGVGLLDFLHTIAYAGMPDFVTPSGPEKAINFWLVARYLSALGLLAVAVLPWRPVSRLSVRWQGLLGVTVLVALVAWLALFRVEWLPRTFIAGQGLTAIKVAAEYGLVATFATAAFFFWRNMRTQQPYDVVGLFAAVSTMALSELFFTLYSDVADIFNLLGHVYKVIAYAFVYKSIFVDNIQAPYQRLNAANRMLEQQIEERTRTQSQLELAASVFSHAREGILITDNQGNIVEVNAMFTQITGYSREEAIGRNPRILLSSGRHEKAFFAARAQALQKHGHWVGEVWNRRKNGEDFAEMLTVSVVRDPAGAVLNYVALFTDITPLKKHQDELEHIAHYDALTGMPNRVLLADRLQQAMLQSQRRNSALAVAYLDLDGFKPVNDQHGHEVGDQLLVTLSQRMKASLRESDTLARIGGDEFVALLVDIGERRDCELLLSRLLQAAATPVRVDGALLQLSASIGVTLYPQDNADADQLVRHADQAMYLAKQAGKNRFHLFDVAQDAAIQSQRESLEHIRVALDRQEFVLYYQPKVNMRTGAIIGAEALIRWQHPERGLLAPAAFLPVIEGQPISIEIGEWVIQTALAQMALWRGAGLDIGVSVNIGALQLQQTGFVARLGTLLAAHPTVPAQSLELEILETSALEDMAQISEVMHACQAIGVRFALDDFGTGYSSLTYLKRLPAELLKIDQSFVRDMLTDVDDLAIVKGVIGLASAFRRSVIAEGVETVAHGQTLLALGCDLAQGYGIARPMPAADLPGWARQWRPDVGWMDAADCGV
ncbi:MAG TPA: MASE3 domain-containing protein [Rhodoferax sp.]|nr:MASE3 domain-containing protein [Rhodoferax sp.]